MDTPIQSIQLGLLTQAEINEIELLSPISQCLFTQMPHQESTNTSSCKVLLELRGDYVVQFDPNTSFIVSGFKCDYQINFEIVRNPAHPPNLLGTPYGIQFTFLNSGKKVRLVTQNVKSLEHLASKLEKKYIVQLGFHESFKAVKILGKGLTATVYKAQSFRDRKDVAIKSFKRSVYFATPNGKPSFQKQFKILSILQHKNLCAFESVYETQNTTYIVMENLALSLFGWIQKYGFPSFDEGKKIVCQLLKGLQYLHSKGIMHRDLKLENIMVRKDSKQNVEIVIVDLGLAEHTNSQVFLYTRCGTPGYVAPQILKHKNESEKYNQLCDIFSIGVIFHILFFKKTIFEGSEVKEVIRKNTQCNIDYSAQYFSAMPSEGLDLLKKMLEKDPSKRITATEALNHQFLKAAIQTEYPSKLDYTIESIKNIIV